MTYRDPDPIQPTRCPWCTSPEQVQPATDHERDRTGFEWWAACCKQLFHGTATEYQRIRARVLADAAESMVTSPKPSHEREDERP